jgi:hypothetical protein
MYLRTTSAAKVDGQQGDHPESNVSGRECARKVCSLDDAERWRRTALGEAEEAVRKGFARPQRWKLVHRRLAIWAARGPDSIKRDVPFF